MLPSYQRGSNELGCLGDADQREACEEESCPVWTEWSEWTECPVTCGGGVQVCEKNRENEIKALRAYLGLKRFPEPKRT